VPIVLAVNKADLTSSAAFGEKDVEQSARAFDCDFYFTSAKTGDNVEEVFRRVGALCAETQLRLT